MHTYTIRLMGDCLVDVTYPFVRDYLGAPILPEDYERQARYAGLHPHWIKEMALIYKHGYNAAIVQESHRGPQR